MIKRLLPLLTALHSRPRRPAPGPGPTPGATAPRPVRLLGVRMAGFEGVDDPPARARAGLPGQLALPLEAATAVS